MARSASTPSTSSLSLSRPFSQCAYRHGRGAQALGLPPPSRAGSNGIRRRAQKNVPSSFEPTWLSPSTGCNPCGGKAARPYFFAAVTVDHFELDAVAELEHVLRKLRRIGRGRSGARSTAAAARCARPSRGPLRRGRNGARPSCPCPGAGSGFMCSPPSRWPPHEGLSDAEKLLTG